LSIAGIPYCLVAQFTLTSPVIIIFAAVKKPKKKPQTEGLMRTKLVLLDVFAIVFSWAWIAAGALALYFLYGAVASGGSWRNMILATFATIGAKLMADMFGQNRQRLDYINKLLRRGYSPAEACAAWRTAHGGGFNLLMSLQQSDTVRLGISANQAMSRRR
jgi:hypothetical protein